MKTVEWLQSWLRTRQRAKLINVLFIGIGGLLWLSLTGVVVALTLILPAEEFGWRDKALFFGLALIGFPIYWTYIGSVVDKVAPSVAKFLDSARTIRGFAIRFIVAVLGGAISIVVIALVVDFLDELFEAAMWKFVFRPIRLVVEGLLVVWSLTFLDGLITLLGAAFVFVIRCVVGCARWLMWRIAEFPKGPLAAITLILTSVLAVLRILLVP